MADLLHPLTTFEWKESKKLEVRDPTLCTQAVYLNGYIYIGISACFSAIHGKVYALSTDLTTWNAVTPTKREGFALTTFQSKLVLVGGKCETTKELYNTLLTSSDGTEWQDKTLPPMSAGRSEALAFSVGENEYLIVAGGVDSSNRPVNTVEVLVGQRWFSLSPLPRPCCQVRVTFHCGNVYLFGGPGSYYCQVFCRLAALKKACIEAKKNNTDKTLWEQFPSVDRIHSPVSFRGQLIDMGRRRSSKICAYNPFTRTWVHVEDLPIRYSASTAVVTSAGELVVIGRSSFTAKAFKATMTTSPFPDSRFSLSCLSRLEMAGIQLKKLLQDIPNFHKAAQLPDSAAPPVFKNLPYYSHYNARIEMERVFSRWIAGDSRLPPTWRSLLSVLIELGLAELSQQVEDCLNSNWLCSLKECCTSVIISALMDQRTLHPDQLPRELPDYVPTTVRTSLTQLFRAHTHTTITV